MCNRAAFFFFALLSSSLLLFAETQFERARITKIESIDNSHACEIEFEKSDATNFSDFAAGDLLELKNPWQMHHRHVYSISRFNKGGTRLSIIVDQEYKTGYRQKLPSPMQHLSSQLCKAEPGDEKYHIKILKARAYSTNTKDDANFSAVWTRPIAMVGYGGAVTRQLGFLRHVADMKDNWNKHHPIWLIHIVHDGETHFLETKFRELASSELKGIFHYIAAPSNSSVGVPHFQEDIPGLRSHFNYFLDEFIATLTKQNLNANDWTLLVAAHDATHYQRSEVEEELQEKFEARFHHDHEMSSRFIRSQWIE